MKHALRIHVGQRVVVFMDGLTLSGRLDEATPDGVRLVRASAITEGREPIDVDGVAFIPAASIAWVQVVTS